MGEKGADKTIVEWILKWQPLIEDSSSTLGALLESCPPCGRMQSASCCADGQQTELQDANHDNLN